MNSHPVLVWLAIACLLTVSAAAWAQDPVPETEVVPEEEQSDLPIGEQAEEQAEGQTEEQEEYSVKAYSISFWGGWFSGTTFLDLQPLADRTQVEEGSNEVYKYNGAGVFTPQELDFGTWKYDGARKEIEPGPMVGVRLGIYVSENFHLDLVGAYGKTEAKTTFINSDPENPSSPYREVPREDPQTEGSLEIDGSRDPNVSIFIGGGRMVYDAKSVKFLGFSPSIGFGIGGIINRFSHLEDKTGLYFELSGGLNYTLFKNFLLNLEFSALTFSFSREELQYGKQVAYMGARLGLTWMIPVGTQASPAETE